MVSEKYKKQLDDLAETLVTSRRFGPKDLGQTAVAPNLDYETPRENGQPDAQPQIEGFPEQTPPPESTGAW